MRILLAEDETRMAMALIELLRFEGYDVDHVADGPSALLPSARTPRAPRARTPLRVRLRSFSLKSFPCLLPPVRLSYRIIPIGGKEEGTYGIVCSSYLSYMWHELAQAYTRNSFRVCANPKCENIISIISAPDCGYLKDRFALVEIVKILMAHPHPRLLFAGTISPLLLSVPRMYGGLACLSSSQISRNGNAENACIQIIFVYCNLSLKALR